VAIGGRGIADVRVDQAAVDALVNGPAGPVAAFLVNLAQRTTQEAKRGAPIGDQNSKLGHPSGYLRSQIGWIMGRDTTGLYADIGSPALTSRHNPHPGQPYGLYNERPDLRPYPVPKWVKDKEGPYLAPALEMIIGSL